MLMQKGLLSGERVKLMESWEHSGFTQTKRSAGVGENEELFGQPDPLLCPDCLALWDVPKARQPPLAAGGPVDFEYVPCAD